MFGTSADPRKGHAASSEKSKSSTPEPPQTVPTSKPPGSPGKSPVSSQPQTPPSPVVGTGLGQGVPGQMVQPPSVTAEPSKPVNPVVKQMQQPVVQPPPDKPVVQGMYYHCLFFFFFEEIRLRHGASEKSRLSILFFIKPDTQPVSWN